MPNFIIGVLVGLVKNSSKVVGITIAEMFGLVVNKDMVARSAIYLLSIVARWTNNTFDNAELEKFKQVLRDNGFKID